MQRGRLALIAVAVSLASMAVVVAMRPAPKSARLLFTGDIMLSRQVEVEHRRTGGSPWDSLATLFARSDWVGGNLEGAIGTDSACAGSSSAPCFAFAPDVPRRLAAAGFAALTTENNHAADLGAAGRAITARALAGAGVMPVSFDESPRFARINDVTVAVIAITTVRGADGRAQAIPSLEIAQRLRLAHTLANVVVVSIHWGTELHDWPNALQRTSAEWLVDHGADIVVGHHPHVVQPPECVHGHPVFFSLGNHVFDQKYPDTKDGLIADCTAAQGQVRCSGIRTHARRGSSVPVPSGTLHEAALAACAVPVRPSLVVSGFTIRPAAWSAAAEDSAGVVLEGWRDGAARWLTRRVSLVSLAALTADDGEPLLLALERHPSAMDGEIAARPHVYAVGNRGLVAKWRGTALAWPLLDAIVDADGSVCALHRGDSFLRINPTVTTTRTMRYRWNGFGFSAASGAGSVCARSFFETQAADTVDSLNAARRATVMDTIPLRAARSSPSATPDAADSALKDTTRRRTTGRVLGPKVGARHPAFRDTGSDLDSLWPVKGPVPLPGSILPEKRIIAFYGNPLSKRMGILGAFASEDMLRKLDAEIAAWNRVDPAHPTQPALHLIVLVADPLPGPSGKYRTRHDSAMIERVYGWARSRKALLFLDLQVGQSTLQQELPWIEKFLIRPDVHLGIDPEFSMKGGGIPGKRVGTYDAADINYATRFLAGLVEKHKLPPKILVVHRFTPGGVTNVKKITLDPRVQFVMHMDGFGPSWMKRDTYWRDIKRQPVQFTGWKQFTKARNDNPPTPRAEILRLWPVPLYIQIQ